MILFNQQLRDKGVHTFPNGIILKVNVIARVEFELAYFKAVVQQFSHYVTETSTIWQQDSSYKTYLFKTVSTG